MPSKIETSLTPEQLQEFFLRCSQLRGVKLRDIQALADEFGVEISLMSAKAFKEGDAWQEYLDGLKRKRELAESVAAIAQNGVALSDGATSKFAAKVFDAIDSLDPEDIGTERGNNVSLAIARLRQGDQRAKKLEADLKLRDEQIARLERERTEWEQKRAQVAAALDRAKNAPAATADDVRKAAVAEIDKLMGIAR
jgi:hypothetical protein